MPLTRTRPMAFRAAPLVTRVSGKWPASVAALVISTGRSRVMEASRMASGFGRQGAASNTLQCAIAERC